MIRSATLCGLAPECSPRLAAAARPNPAQVLGHEEISGVNCETLPQRYFLKLTFCHSDLDTVPHSHSNSQQKRFRTSRTSNLRLPTASAWATFPAMSNREFVIDLVSRLPEDTPLEDIARRIELLAGINVAREQAKRGEGIPAEEARKLIDSWVVR